VSDRVAIIDGGLLLALDSPKQLLDDLGSAVLEVHVPSDPKVVLDQLVAATAVRHAPIVRHQQVSAVVDADALGNIR
jgi:hypothetical protein